MIFNKFIRKSQKILRKAVTKKSEGDPFEAELLYDALLDSGSNLEAFDPGKIPEIFHASPELNSINIASEIKKRKLLRGALESAYSYESSLRVDSLGVDSFREEMENAWNLLGQRIENDISMQVIPKKISYPDKTAERRIYKVLQGEFLHGMMFSRKGFAAAVSFALFAFLIVQQGMKPETESMELVLAPEVQSASELSGAASEELASVRSYYLGGSEFRMDTIRPQRLSSGSQPSFSFVSSGSSPASGIEGSRYVNSHFSQLISNEGLHAFREYHDFNNKPSHDIPDSVRMDGFMPLDNEGYLAGAPVDSAYLRFIANE